MIQWGVDYENDLQNQDADFRIIDNRLKVRFTTSMKTDNLYFNKYGKEISWLHFVRPL